MAKDVRRDDAGQVVCSEPKFLFADRSVPPCGQDEILDKSGWMNQLYYDDNLQAPREHIGDESVDLICLDPPFNSKRDDNLPFKSPKGVTGEAQIEVLWDVTVKGRLAIDELSDSVARASSWVVSLLHFRQTRRRCPRHLAKYLVRRLVRSE